MAIVHETLVLLFVVQRLFHVRLPRRAKFAWSHLSASTTTPAFATYLSLLCCRFLGATLGTTYFSTTLSSIPNDKVSTIHFVLELGKIITAPKAFFVVGLCSLSAAGAMWFEAATHVENAVWPCAVPCYGVAIGGMAYMCVSLHRAAHYVIAARSTVDVGQKGRSETLRMKREFYRLLQQKQDNPLQLDRSEYKKHCCQVILRCDVAEAPSAFLDMTERIFRHHVNDHLDALEYGCERLIDSS